MELNVAVAKACGLDVDRVSGAFAIVVRRDEEGRVDQRLGGWKGVGNYVNDVQDILNDLLPADVPVRIERFSADGSVATVGQEAIEAMAPRPARALLLAVAAWHRAHASDAG
jgi:hypothetical protein